MNRDRWFIYTVVQTTNDHAHCAGLIAITLRWPHLQRQAQDSSLVWCLSGICLAVCLSHVFSNVNARRGQRRFGFFSRANILV